MSWSMHKSHAASADGLSCIRCGIVSREFASTTPCPYQSPSAPPAALVERRCPECDHAWHESSCPVETSPGPIAAFPFTCGCIAHEDRAAALVERATPTNDYGKHWNMGGVPYRGEHGRSENRGTASGEERSGADKGSPRHADHVDGAVIQQPDQRGRSSEADEVAGTHALAPAVVERAALEPRITRVTTYALNCNGESYVQWDRICTCRHDSGVSTDCDLHHPAVADRATAQEPLVALIAKWREPIGTLGFHRISQTRAQCADELEALLRAVPSGGEKP